jgi:hypothetical protein
VVTGGGKICGLGACAVGGTVCSGAGDGVVCDTEQSVAAAETCNDVDDDCDGETDEDFELMTSLENCGGCGVACGPLDHAEAWGCVNGVCLVTDCSEGYRDANGLGSDGCEVEWVPSGELWVDAWNVGDPLEDGSEVHPFDSIQEAVDGASEGAIIHVLPGAYDGGIVVSVASLSLVGQGQDQVLVDSPADGAGFTITSVDVSLSGMRVSEGKVGLRIDASGASISNMSIDRAEIGVHLRLLASDATIRDSSIGDARLGIHIEGTEDVSIAGVILADLIFSEIRDENLSGKDAIGVLAEHSDMLDLAYLVISDVNGGIGVSGSATTSGGTGGRAIGLSLVDSINCRASDLVLTGVAGGQGGTDGPLAGIAGGAGGLGAGVSLDRTTGCEFVNVVMTEIEGGDGGPPNSVFHADAGLSQHGFGFVMDEDSLETMIATTCSIEGESIYFIRGVDGLVFEDLVLDADVRPTNWGKLVVIDSQNVTIRNSTISSFANANA